MRLGIIGVGAFTGYVSRRFWNDHAFSKAAALGYELLFGLVPVIAIGLAVLAAFPVFDQVRIDLQDYIAKSFLPEHGEEVKTLFQRFVDNTRELTLFSIVALIVTAILLFDTVDGVFSHIWRQTVPRPLLTRVAMFWAIMTLLPLLIAGSIALSTFLAHRIGVLASAAIRLASTANPSVPTRPAAMHPSTTRSKTRRRISLSRKRSLRARVKAE
jgi:membrane protein